MNAFKGWKTFLFGLLMVVIPPILSFVGTIDWSNSGLPSWAISLIGFAIIALRSITTTPVFKAAMIAGLLVLSGLGLSACGNLSSSGISPSTVCQAVQMIQSIPGVSQQLATVSSTSALGVVWADFQSGCSGGQPTVGVSASWTAMVGGMFKTLLPQVLPTVAQYVLPLLIGLI